MDNIDLHQTITNRNKPQHGAKHKPISWIWFMCCYVFVPYTLQICQRTFNAFVLFFFSYIGMCWNVSNIGKGLPKRRWQRRSFVLCSYLNILRSYTSLAFCVLCVSANEKWHRKTAFTNRPVVWHLPRMPPPDGTYITRNSTMTSWWAR